MAVVTAGPDDLDWADPVRALPVDQLARRLPPGQVLARTWPVMHYGRVPVFRPESWDLRVIGATRSGSTWSCSYEQFRARPAVEVVADFHCVTGLSRLDAHWSGVRARDVLREAPPHADVTNALVWAEHGYCANMRISDLWHKDALFAYRLDGVELSPDQGWPLRLVVPHLYAWKGPKWVRGIEYLTGERKGFWEERGYHDVGDPWLEQRFAEQPS
jgi:DMSO/TMAO reductase YedYZ molybdopterin-dependent catalytic subunit